MSRCGWDNELRAYEEHLLSDIASSSHTKSEETISLIMSVNPMLKCAYGVSAFAVTQSSTNLGYTKESLQRPLPKLERITSIRFPVKIILVSRVDEEFCSRTV